MGPMSISVEQVLVVMGAAGTLTTAIFWGAFLLGRLFNRIERVEQKVEEHDAILRLKA